MRRMHAALVMTVVGVQVAQATPQISASDASGATVTLGDQRVVVRLSQRPETRVVVDLTTNDGRSTQLVWDPQQLTSLSRTITLPSDGPWFASVDAARGTLPSSDGKSALFTKYEFAWIQHADDITATGKQYQIATSATTTWNEITGAPQLVVSFSKVMTRQAGAMSATAVVPEISSLSRGLDSSVPESIKDALQSLAEIAMDRAKAEGMRLFKDKVVRTLCTDLTVDNTLGHASPKGLPQEKQLLLLPETCGQLATLRMTDLGASATGLLDALREDVIDTVFPYVIGAISAEVANTFQTASPVVDIGVKLAQQAIRRGLRSDDLRLAIIGLLAVAEANNSSIYKWKPAIRVALRCAEQPCSLGDIVAFVETECTADPNNSLCTAIKADLAPYATRLLAILQPPPNTDPMVLTGQLVDLIVDMARTNCVNDEKLCVVALNGVRDVIVGVVERDYLRALGGVTALLRVSGIDLALKGKPIELLATIASYVQTYRDTQSKDPKEAHELRKQALEGLIDAATDRSNRGGDTVVSIGASVGFALGGSHLFYGVARDQDDKAMHELRLPLGVTVQHLPGPENCTWCPGVFVHASVADLAQFVSSPVTATNMTSQQTQWSDFVSPGLQLGIRLFSVRTPLVIGAEVSFIPRLTLEKSDGSEFRTSVFRYGVFAGFNVPFFDLN
jgi:hypothetical protein